MYLQSTTPKCRLYQAPLPWPQNWLCHPSALIQAVSPCHFIPDPPVVFHFALPCLVLPVLPCLFLFFFISPPLLLSFPPWRCHLHVTARLTHPSTAVPSCPSLSGWRWGRDAMGGNYLHTEGSWDRVHQVIGQAHTILHEQGIVRIQTDIRVGSRTDKVQSFEDKVNKVQELLKE
ncbi:hypothetical protein BDV19DRAFT_290761 [Aspergillus venezuelensis]